MNAGDSFLSSQTLEKVSPYFHKNIDILYGDSVIKMSEGNYQYKILPDKISDSFFIVDCLLHQASYIKTELFQKYGNYNTEYKIVSDLEKWINFIQAGCSFEHLPFVCAIHNYNGISSQMTPKHSVERAEVSQKYLSATVLENTTSVPVAQYYNANPYIRNINTDTADIPDAIAINNEENRPKNPDISIIVPVFNTALYLESCLDFLLAQSHPNIEIICVNDGSYDNSLDILKDYAKKDARVKIYSFEENVGVATCRNYALSKAQGEYISFVDSDDWLSLDFCEKLYKCAKSDAYDLVKGGCYLSYEDGTCDISCFNSKITNNMKQNKRINIMNREEFSTYLYRNTFLQNIQAEFPKLPNGEDRLFLFNVLLHKPKSYLIEDTFYYYRQRSNSAYHSYSVLNISAYLKHYEMQCVLLNTANISKSEYMEFYSNVIFAGALYYYTSTFLKVSSDENAVCLQCLCDVIKKCKYLDEFLADSRYQSLKYFATKDIMTELDVILFVKEIYLDWRNFIFSYYKYKLRYKLSRGEKRVYYKYKYLICKKIRNLEQSLAFVDKLEHV